MHPDDGVNQRRHDLETSSYHQSCIELEPSSYSCIARLPFLLYVGGPHTKKRQYGYVRLI